MVLAGGTYHPLGQLAANTINGHQRVAALVRVHPDHDLAQRLSSSVAS
jgi:hypothetical protein